MPEIPALRDALVRAGVRRRRRRRAVGAAVPAFAAVAAAVAFALPRAADPERDVPPTSAPLVQGFSVFARPQTDRDRALPARLTWFAGPDLDPTLTRRVGGAFVLATTTGSVCVAQGDGDQVTGSCAPAEEVRAGARVAARTADSLTLLVPDGAHDIRTDYRDTGWTLSAAAQDNVIGVADPDRLAALSWTDASGVRRIERFGEQRRWAMARRCAGVFPFDPLPADARALATRQALIDAVRVEPGVTTARVLGSTAAPKTSCSAAVSRRLVAVQLQLGSGRRTVFVGWVKGEAQTFVLPSR
ncbi:hypothetical protein C8N24_1116 [Solirubrobacter pauli]|uniref:Uncharacterized protein n=1 Tax=Solirubrobacter pauli TaxID=166793 RepID=A0A660LEF4_9ACTN|nr:hypothetical protein [Solirubrobacter pauli]RKQ91294.1 hypothetical protein C8N24_1116 [Solirubrobacter pauli]